MLIASTAKYSRTVVDPDAHFHFDMLQARKIARTSSLISLHSKTGQLQGIGASCFVGLVPAKQTLSEQKRVLQRIAA